MTTGNCRNVHRATLATRLRTTPPRAKQPPDARLACPKGAGPVRVLFDSEKDKPRGKVDAGSTWVRAPNQSVFPPVSANATSGHTSWFSSEPPLDAVVSSLTMHPIALPTGRPAYLWFQQWRLLEVGPNTHRIFDGGTVEIADVTNGGQPKDASGRPWVNGPHDVITDQSDNPSAGRVSFGGDSRGYLASRLALKHYAGHAVSPQFTMNTDGTGAEVGWYLDDIRVFTCGRAPVPKSTPRIVGAATVGAELTAKPGRWSPHDARKRVQWYADGHAIAGATGTSYVVRGADLGKRLAVKVTARSHGRHAATFSAATGPVTNG
jgi:hypothetical protein